VTSVESQGKNLLIRFSNGLELRTHLRMNGSWHRYRPGERWRRAEGRARVVLEVPGAVAVCFDAPVAELFEIRAEHLHPSLSRLGPDLLDPAFDDEHVAEAVRRLRDPGRAAMSVSEALLDQRALAGIGNIWRNETLFAERIDPFVAVADLDDATLERLVRRSRELLRASAAVAPGRGPMRVYGRAGRPCPRCGTMIRSGPTSGDLPRTTYWCPRCQRTGGDGR
jgi:endonuclease-8